MRRCSRSLIIYEGPLRPALRSWKVFWALCSESTTAAKGRRTEVARYLYFFAGDGRVDFVKAYPVLDARYFVF